MQINLSGNPFFLNTDQIDWVNQTLSEMTVSDKIGQLFCILGDSYSDIKLDELVREKSIGGVLFRPVRKGREIREVFEHLDTIAKFPLLHAANLEEGGAGAASDGTFFASQLQIAATDDIEFVDKFALCCAEEGLRVGINWTFSPVSDIDFNYQNPITNCRTFGSDVKKVAEYTQRFMKVVQDNNIAACAKHFPGDGVDFRDQHLHPTYNSLSADQWMNSYGKVYKGLIDKGLLSVMVGHILLPQIEMQIIEGLKFEQCLPASLSPALLRGLLRGTLGFNGLITTDASIMGGYTMSMKREKAIGISIASGCDMIVFSTDIDEDLAFAEEAYYKRIITEERLDEAVTRILALKAWARSRGRNEFKDVSFSKDRAKCADQAITLVKNTVPELTVNPDDRIKLIFLGNEECADGNIIEMLTGEFAERGFDVEIYYPFKDDIHGTKNLSDSRVTIMVFNYPPESNRTTVRPNWCQKHALEIPRFLNEEKIMAVSFANPYHLQDIPRIKTYINAYSATRATISAVVSKICGESEFKGISPVDAFCGLPDTRI